MKNILYISLFVLASLSSCFKAKDECDLTNNILTPPFPVNKDTLLGEGYIEHDSLGVLVNQVDRVIISYEYFNDQDPIFIRNLILEGIDSVAAINWIKNNGGIICSGFEQISHRKYRFYVKDQKSCLILTGILSKNYLILNFDYPDIGNNLKRRVDDKGFVTVEGLNNKGKKVTFRSLK